MIRALKLWVLARQIERKQLALRSALRASLKKAVR